MYPNYGQGEGNNYYNGYAMPRDNVPYYPSNVGGQYYGNFAGQQQQRRYKRAIARGAREDISQATGPRRR